MTTSCSNNSIHTGTNKTYPDSIKTIKITELPVIVLPTIDGGASDDSEVNSFQYPQKDTIDADTLNSLIAAYGAAYQVWLGPAGWVGNSRLGADGNIDVVLHPKTDSSKSGPHIFYYEAPACVGCILEAAARYFPEAMKENVREYHDTAKIPDGIQIKHLSSTLITYSLPSRSDLSMRGVAHFTGDQDYVEACFILPKKDTNLADFLINNFIKTKHLK